MAIELFNKALEKASHFIRAIPIKIFYFLELQLFITILALPIFLSWGLPISFLSPIGNLIFTPWLTAFLTLSSILFFMEIISLENSFIINLLEKLNQLFFKILNLADQSFMICFPCPQIFFIPLIPMGLLLTINFRKSSNVYLRVLKLFLLSSLLFFSLKYILAPTNILKYIQNKNEKIVLIKHSSKNALVDLGALSEGRSAQGWTRYQLVPELLKLGIDHLDCLIISKPCSKVFESLIEITKNISIKRLYFQEWVGLIPYTGWKCWRDILELKKKKQIAIVILKDSLNIKLNKDFSIKTQSGTKFLRKGPLKYKPLEVEVNLSKQIIKINN